MKDPELKVIQMDQIAQNQVALRNVDNQSEEFIRLKDSIASQGILNPISVRPGASNAEKPYELIDGLHRFMAGIEIGLAKIPAQIFAMDDAQVLEAQLIANAQRIKTRPVEFAQQIQRILAGKPLLSISQLATDLSMSPGWISERLGLLKLSPEIHKLVDDDTIPLTSAYVLAKLPPDDQKNLLQAASTEEPAQFVPRAQARLKEIRESNRAGRKPGAVKFEAQAKIRKRTELIGEFEKPTKMPAIIKQSGEKDPLKVAIVILGWVLQLDPSSIEAAEAKYNQHQKEMEAAKAKRKETRDNAKAKVAAEVAAAV